MTTDVREPTAQVPPCHRSGDDCQQQLEIDRAQPVTRDDRMSISWPLSKWQLVIAGSAAALAAVVAAAFVFNISPGNLALFAIVLACPLMHIFMMRGMGHGGQHSCHGSQKKDDKA